jgi:hypothetical protein
MTFDNSGGGSFVISSGVGSNVTVNSSSDLDVDGDLE